MNILFATLTLPHSQTSGGEIASQSFIEAMRMEGHRVRVFGFVRELSETPDGSTVAGVRPIETSSAGWRRYLWLAQSWIYRRPYVVQKFYSSHYLTLLRAAAARQKADLLVIDHAKMGWLVRFAPTLAKAAVLIAHNHESALYAAEAQHEPKSVHSNILRRESRLVARLESVLARHVDQIWTLGPADKASFSAMTDAEKVASLPLPGRLLKQPLPSVTPQFDIGLLGTWAWEVNGRGLDWFVDHVLPLLPRDLKIRVAGRGSERVNACAANIVGIGLIEDANAFLNSARVLAIPTIGGSGIQLKTIEAIAAGVATVSTSMGVRAIENLPDYVKVADSSTAFSAALVQQLNRPLPDRQLANAWALQRRSQFTQTVRHQLELLQTQLSLRENVPVEVRR